MAKPRPLSAREQALRDPEIEPARIETRFTAFRFLIYVSRSDGSLSTPPAGGPMRTMVMVKLLCVAVILAPLTGSALEKQSSDQKTELQEKADAEIAAQRAEIRRIQKISNETEVWYLEPTKGDWSQFRWKKIRGDAASGIMRLIKGAIVSDRAGRSFTLDLPAEIKRERAEGFVILKGPDGGFSGFVRRANFEEKSSLKLITVNSFISEKEAFSWSPKPWFVGIVTEVSLTPFLRAD